MAMWNGPGVTPKPHKTKHAIGGDDALIPADIGAASQVAFNEHQAETPTNIRNGNNTGAIRGINTKDGYIMGEYAIALGIDTEAIGPGSHAEGYQTEASGKCSHAEGNGTQANAENSHAEGYQTNITPYIEYLTPVEISSDGTVVYLAGNYTLELSKAVKIDEIIYIQHPNIYVPGRTYHNIFSINYDSDTDRTKITLENSLETYPDSGERHLHFKGIQIYDSNNHLKNDVSFNDYTAQYNTCIHVEGQESRASGQCSHAEGLRTKASGECSHAEGFQTIANGENSHVEGRWTEASGSRSHAEGFATRAEGDSSHAQNMGTIAQGEKQTAIGQYNVPQGTADSHIDTDNLFIVGNGTNDDNRSNALALTWGGDLEVSNGFIITDKTTETKYRIIIENGTLGVEQV